MVKALVEGLGQPNNDKDANTIQSNNGEKKSEKFYEIARQDHQLKVVCSQSDFSDCLHKFMD